MTIFKAFSPNRSAKMAKKTSATKKTLNRDKIISATLTLTESDGWASLTMAGVAEKVSLTTHDVVREFPSKLGLLWGIMENIDRAVLIEQTVSGEHPRERLFDVLMARFDAIAPYKDAIKSIARASSRDPVERNSGPDARDGIPKHSASLGTRRNTRYVKNNGGIRPKFTPG